MELTFLGTKSCSDASRGSGGGERNQRGEEEEEAAAEAGNGSQLVMPEDGYEWKKYGQKFIKNIQKIRSYFRCRHRLCGAKKKVEWHPRDPSGDLRIVYEGAHQHGAPAAAAPSPGGQHQGGAPPPTDTSWARSTSAGPGRSDPGQLATAPGVTTEKKGRRRRVAYACISSCWLPLLRSLSLRTGGQRQVAGAAGGSGDAG
ncbi:unnamed protein product [Miscanthus lutarioriparius]|uniref:WRKY domain-containing protein n=1 Tax=Miscanthus lutarioriparius TaxID=422564 RepID=A0A811SN08_9POAL|nr:unnamed protein product [Miscanthus lutarioriparius]